LLLRLSYIAVFATLEAAPGGGEMEDKRYETYRKSVYERLSQQQKDIIPLSWWDSVIKYYYRMGYLEDQTVHVILETMSKK